MDAFRGSEAGNWKIGSLLYTLMYIYTNLVDKLVDSVKGIGG